MAKISKRVVDAAKESAKDYFIWDEAIAGFGVRVLASGKRSYLIQYRSGGRTRRYSIGPHGVWTPEAARNEAKRLLGRVAQGEDPAEDRRLDRSAITMKELCERYVADLKAGLILGKGGRPKKPTTMTTDQSRIDRHILPLIGTRRVKDLTRADVQRLLMDVMAGRTRRDAKTKKLRGRSIVRGGVGTATRTVSLLGGILTYAKDLGIIATNPVHGVRKPKDGIPTRRLSEDEYRTLGSILREKEADPNFQTTVEIIRDIALTGARRGEIIGLKWADVDFDGSCLRLSDSKEGLRFGPSV